MAFGTNLLIGFYAKRQHFIHEIQEVVVDFASNKKSSQRASAQVPLSQFMKINLI